MSSDVNNVLDRIRPRDRKRVADLLVGLLRPAPGADIGHVSISRVGGGGDETQVARWEPADQVALTAWLPPVLEAQAIEAAPTTAKVRIRGWGSGGTSGPSATAVLDAVPAAPANAAAALPVPAMATEPPASSPPPQADAGLELVPTGPSQVELINRIATLERRLDTTEDRRRWYEEAHRGARAEIMVLEQELRQAHAALAPTLVDRAALQRELDRAERKLERLEAIDPEQDRRERKLRRQRDQARKERDAIAEERDEAESTAEQAIELLREKFGYPDDD
jgi:hypothetical protein